MAIDTERQTALSGGIVQELREAVHGAVIAPGDDGYDEARSIWNAYHDKRPALIVQCAGAADVMRALELARSEGLAVAVRGGGHSLPGFSTVDGGVVIDLSPMRGVVVDPIDGTATVQGGATWADVDHETQAFGLAVTGGLVSTTGVGGFTTGGGIGHLMRKHGLTCDNVIAADVVTADGRYVRASADQNADLFWGLRGGGGNFGIVTSFEYRLHEVGPVVYGGAIFYPGDSAGQILRAYREWCETLPDDTTTVVNLTIAPPVPFLPEEVHGKPIVALIGCHAGSHEDGERIMQPMREVAEPVADLFGPIPYTALQQLIDPLFGPGARNHMRAGMLRGLDDGAIDAMCAAHARQPGDLGEIHVHHFGGAVARVGADDTAFGDRTAPYVLNVLGRWSDPADDDGMKQWSTDLHVALGEALTGRAYVNFVGDAGADPDALFGDKVERLRAVKDAWDPENVFRLNQNIAPSAH